MDEAATSSEHWKILSTSGMGFFTDAYDLFIIGVVATMVTKEWHIASYQKDLLSSLALLTSAVGAILFGHIAMLPMVGLSKTSALVAGVSVLGLLATLVLLPEPKGSSLEDFTENPYPASAVATSLAESRGTRVRSG
jgi:MFS family permease